MSKSDADRSLRLLSTRVDIETAKAFAVMAAAADRSTAAELRRLIRNHVIAHAQAAYEQACKAGVYRTAGVKDEKAGKTDLRGVPIPNLTDIRPDAA